MFDIMGICIDALDILERCREYLSGSEGKFGLIPFIQPASIFRFVATMYILRIHSSV